MFDKATIPIPCPECSHETKKTVAWIKANDTFVCGGCGKTIQLEREGLLAGLKRVDKTTADFRRKLRGISARSKR